MIVLMKAFKFVNPYRRVLTLHAPTRIASFPANELRVPACGTGIYWFSNFQTKPIVYHLKIHKIYCGKDFEPRSFYAMSPI